VRLFVDLERSLLAAGQSNFRFVMVGEGNERDWISKNLRFGETPGILRSDALAEAFADMDVFVFPSQTDTFGLVLLEAMASGLPVAAFPVTGPVDVVKPGETGVLSEDLRQAALDAFALDRAHVRARAQDFSWENAVRLFLANITSACLKEPARAKALRRFNLAKRFSETPRRS